MKFLVSSDHHLDAVTSGVSRFDELAAALQLTVDAAISERVDAYLFLGDAFDPDAGPVVYRCLDALVTACVRLSDEHIPVVMISGNHCVVEDGTGTTVLTPLGSLPGVRLFEQPGRTNIGNGKQAVDILALPFVATSRSYDPRTIVLGMLDEPGPVIDKPNPLVVISHLNVPGLVPGEEHHEMPRGREVWLPEAELLRVSERRPTLVLNGHHHRRQRYRTPLGLEVQIVGALSRFTFGSDQAEQPGYIMVEI